MFLSYYIVFRIRVSLCVNSASAFLIISRFRLLVASFQAPGGGSAPPGDTGGGSGGGALPGGDAGGGSGGGVRPVLCLIRERRVRLSVLLRLCVRLLSLCL